MKNITKKATLKEAVQGRDESSNNKVLGIDINQFKHSIDLFKYSLDYAEAIVNTVREPLVVLNKELKVITANKAFYKTFDLVPVIIENQPIYELGSGELNIPKFKSLLNKVLKKSVSFEDFEIEYHVPNKGKRTLLLNARKFYRQINNTQTILLAIEDITKIRNYEKQKDEFALLIIHELKNPVTTISLYLQLLQANLLKQGDKKLYKYTDIMEEQVRVLTGLINGLLNTSYTRAVGFEFKDEVFNLDDLIEKTIEEVKKTSDTHEITVAKRINANVRGDRVRITQVLINLLTNAIKYSPNSNQVLVSSHLKDDMVYVSIKDFGIGISEINQRKIFRRFFRVNHPGKSTSGFGLGLDISLQIIRHHKGKMWVESKEGKGSVFNFSLPVVKE